MRLVISALLAALVHAYWLFSNIREGGSATPGKVPKSVVISLAAGVQRPAPGPREKPASDAETLTQRRKPVPVAARPAITQSREETIDRDGPVGENGATEIRKMLERKEKDQVTAAEAPVSEADDGPVARHRPAVRSVSKIAAKQQQSKRASPEGSARKVWQRSQAARARSQIAKLKQVERETAAARSAEPQAGRHESGETVPDEPGEVQRDAGAAVNRQASVTQALNGVLKEARPMYKLNPSPPYPRVARRRGYEGTVIVRALVGVDGLVNEVRLDESSGYETLDGAALKTVQRWAFEPAVRGTDKVEMWVRIPLRFDLD